jgi:hypothetical protein
MNVVNRRWWSRLARGLARIFGHTPQREADGRER